MKKPFLNIKYPIILTLILVFSATDAQAGPDVEIVSLDIGKFEYYPNGEVRVDCDIRNIGDETARNVIMALYVSVDTTITPDDHLLREEVDESIVPGVTSHNLLLGWIRLRDLPPGEYYIGVIITCSGDTNPANDTDYISTSISFNGSDLTLESIELSDFTHSEPDEVSVDYLVRNIGPWNSFRYSMSFYASSDTTINADDYRVRFISHNGIEAGGVASHSARIRFVDIPRGDYYVGITFRCDSDVDKTNNSICSNETLTIIPIPPDIIVQDVQVRDVWVRYGLYRPGDQIDVYVLVENIGSGPAEGYTVDCYASTDDNIESSDYHIGNAVRGPLGRGEEDQFDTSFTLPDDIPEGDYYIGVTVTCPYDTNPGNNEGEDGNPVWVGPPVYLVVQSVNATDDIYKPGDNIMVNIVIENIGEQSPYSCNIDFYASTDRYISVNDYEIKNVSRSGLTPGESHSFNTTCQFPSDIPEGDYYIGVIVTWSYDGGSENTDRNSSRTVWVGPPVDLAVQSLNATNGVYQPGDEIVVYSLIDNVGEQTSENYTVDYYASTDANIATSDYHISYVNRSGLAAGEQHSYETTCQFPFNIPAGNYYIGIIVTCPKDYDPADNVGDDNTTVELVHPAGYVCGQMKYQDRWSRKHPIRYALVKIYEDDNNNNPLDDRVIGQTYTDHNGTYGVIVLNDDQSGQDIYVKVFTDSNDYPGITSKICDVKDDIFGETYSLESSLYLHPQDSSVIVDMTAPKSRGAFMVCDSVIEGFHKAKTFFDVNLPEITTYWPSSEDSSYYISSVGIFIAQDDRGDRDVIMHEYGHYIAETYGFAQGSVGEDPTHYWNLDLRYNPDNRTDEEAMNLAFREAWASLFSIATQRGDFWYPNSGDTRYHDVDEGSGKTFKVDLEEDTDAHDSPGQYFENMNCCALWDIFDDHDSRDDDNDTLSDTSLSKIWTISRDYQPDDIIDFWNSWFQSYDYASEITRIFRDHEMSFPKPEQTNPTP